MISGMCGATVGLCESRYSQGFNCLCHPGLRRIPRIVLKGQGDLNWRNSGRLVCCSAKFTYLTSMAGVTIFHAGTTSKAGQLVTAGGRVLAITAHASTLQGAVDLAYAGVESVNFEGKTFRRDIAHR